MVGTPATPASKIQRTPSSTPGGSKFQQEKILGTIRIRPLNRREQALYYLIAWDCPDDRTIVFKNPNHERPATPYTFVFDPTCSTQRVYEEGAKNVALSALMGINATIFAYGQTTSGKAFTMSGITESATQAREFILKRSALEIYNDTIDLLNRESDSLRLLDDPEKGTIVEKLVEEIVKDSQHLRHLIGICEAQRQVGETDLNDKSSRSHQIIWLRGGHIPYRDSKLTQILQHSLGGNARTASICDMSPALSHVEQTMNALSFASSAKEVTNNAQVKKVRI
ncbi:kinesin-like protein NACK2 [Hevea brasiliensis]|uniref:kinesin-like protein NACK2 n=1 Tax=Hevea brasiliensis TaxID=3981 RepID=UPI0025DE3607|nr:kinesin-like protein NACK2 [Hevea brasiliensis]